MQTLHRIVWCDCLLAKIHRFRANVDRFRCVEHHAEVLSHFVGSPAMNSSLRKMTALVVAILIVLVILGYWYMFGMPGESHAGELPAMDKAQTKAAEQLRGDVEMLSQEIGTRNLAKLNALVRAREYVVRQLEDAGYATKLETFEVNGKTAANVVAERTGRERPEEIVLVGAHYDSVPSTPGADDNASGVAGGLELARRLATRQPARTVRFVFFANEEPPYFQTEKMGSYQHAKRARENGDDIVVMFSLEMLGYYSDESGTQHYPAGLNLLYPSTGNFIAFVGNLASRSELTRTLSTFRESVDFPSEGISAPQFVPGIGLSDQWSFWQFGYGAVMVTDTAFFRNDNYHAPSDRADTLDYERMSLLVDGLEAVVDDWAHPP